MNTIDLTRLDTVVGGATRGSQPLEHDDLDSLNYPFEFPKLAKPKPTKR